MVYVDPKLEQYNFISDYQRLSQVIVNLLSNAVKFTFKGFVKISAEED